MGKLKEEKHEEINSIAMIQVFAESLADVGATLRTNVQGKLLLKSANGKDDAFMDFKFTFKDSIDKEHYTFEDTTPENYYEQLKLMAKILIKANKNINRE